jgi:hypothetical protein
MRVVFFFGMNPRDEWTIGNIMVVALSLLLLGACLFWGGYGLRSLRPHARRIAIVFGVVGSPFFPLGTLVGGYVLNLLFSDKGKRIFSEEYNALSRRHRS